MSGSTRSYEMARRLVGFGHEVHIVTSWREKIIEDGWFETDEAGIKVHWLPLAYSNEMDFYDRIKAFLLFAIRSTFKALELKGDVVFATSTPLTIALPGIIASKISRIPMVFEVRDLWPSVPIAMGILRNPISKLFARILEKVAYSCSQRIVTLSPGMLEGIEKANYPKEKIFLIPNSSDIEFFQSGKKFRDDFRSQFVWLKDRPLLVYCGTFGAVNGVEFLVDVAAELRKINPEIRVLAVGSGKRWDNVQKRADSLGILNENFFMLDEVPKLQMPRIMAAADIATSLVVDIKELWVNSANKFFDALAAGKPFCINHRGWLADLLESSGAGFVVDVRDPHTSAKLIAEKIVDKDWLSKAGEAAFKLGISKFDRNKLAKKLEKVLFQSIK